MYLSPYLKKRKLLFLKHEQVGMSTSMLSKLDSLTHYAIDEKMTPGIQLLVARKGTIIYNKNFGYHTYKKAQKVTSKNVYDLASLTKILVT